MRRHSWLSSSNRSNNLSKHNLTVCFLIFISLFTTNTDVFILLKNSIFFSFARFRSLRNQESVWYIIIEYKWIIHQFVSKKRLDELIKRKIWNIKLWVLSSISSLSTPNRRRLARVASFHTSCTTFIFWNVLPSILLIYTIPK